MGKKGSNRKIAEDVIQFLDKHMLDPSPANYAFAFLYITETSGLLRKLVDEITDGGMRLTQGEVNEMMANNPEEGSASPSDALDELQAQLRRQALNFSDLANTTLTHATLFNQDLAQGMEQIASGFDLSAVISAMREKTIAVERKLAENLQETETLRQQLDSARDDALRDGLTRLSNRRCMDEKIQEEFARCKHITIGFCDIDHFKSINDRFGHAVGDRVLKAVAEVLQTELSPYPVARFGGEEFVALFPALSEIEAFKLIEKARTTVEQKSFKVRETDQPLGTVTFSAGVATTTSDPQAALRDADSALYVAKNGGRNQTICHRGMTEVA